MDSSLVLLPILVPLSGAALAVLAGRRLRLARAWAVAVLAASLAASGWLLAIVSREGSALVFQSGGWIPPAGITLVADPLSALLTVMTAFVLFCGAIYAAGSGDMAVRYPGFFPLFLAMAAALNGAFLTGDLFNLFVFIELLVISATLLTAISDDRFGVEAAYKYFYMSLLASAMMLLAIGSLYASYGTLNMADLAARVAEMGSVGVAPIAVALLLVVFLIKCAAPPFHFWQPDFHTAAPTAVSAMLSSVVVKLGVYGLLRMTTLLFPAQSGQLRMVLLVIGVAGVLFGGLAALGNERLPGNSPKRAGPSAQSGNLKRMLAYSTLAQVGFILVGVGWGTPPAIAAALVFAFNHSLVKAAMLMLAGAVASRAPVKSAAFSVLRGMGRHAPFAGALFFVGGLALAGVPPTNGFVSKLLLFSSGIEVAAAKPASYLLLVVIAAGGVLTLIYVMRAFQLIWWQMADKDAPGAPPPAEGQPKKRPDRLLAPAVLLTTALALGIWAEPLVRVAWEASLWLGSPAAYIQAVLGG